MIFLLKLRNSGESRESSKQIMGKSIFFPQNLIKFEHHLHLTQYVYMGHLIFSSFFIYIWSCGQMSISTFSELMYNISYIFGTDVQYFLYFRNWNAIFPIFTELMYNIFYIFGTDVQYFLYFWYWCTIYPIFSEMMYNISYIYGTDVQ